MNAAKIVALQMLAFQLQSDQDAMTATMTGMHHQLADLAEAADINQQD